MKPVSTIQDVEIEIKKALKLLRQMPKVGPKSVHSSWPMYLNEEVISVVENGATVYTKPLPEEIDDMDEVLEDWLKSVDYNERNLVVMRNMGYAWKEVVAKFGYARSCLYKKYVKSLKKILKYVLEKQRIKNIGGKNDIL